MWKESFCFTYIKSFTSTDKQVHNHNTSVSQFTKCLEVKLIEPILTGPLTTWTYLQKEQWPHLNVPLGRDPHECIPCCLPKWLCTSLSFKERPWLKVKWGRSSTKFLMTLSPIRRCQCFSGIFLMSYFVYYIEKLQRSAQYQKTQNTWSVYDRESNIENNQT